MRHFSRVFRIRRTGTKRSNRVCVNDDDGVTPLNGNGKYTVLEGNRRAVTTKILKNPALLTGMVEHIQVHAAQVHAALASALAKMYTFGFCGTEYRIRIPVD